LNREPIAHTVIPLNREPIAHTVIPLNPSVNERAERAAA
jgi:hypothetical protein